MWTRLSWKCRRSGRLAGTCFGSIPNPWRILPRPLARLPVILLVATVALTGYAVDPARAACGGDPPLPPEGLGWPVRGSIVNTWSLDCATDAGHRGIDISAARGAEIRAAGAGTVSFAGYTPAEGGSLTVSITHQGGLRSTYLHLASLSVSAGERVGAGQVIGASDGSPLHFGLKLPGGRDTYFNPLLHLSDGSVTDPAPGHGNAPHTAPAITPSANVVPAANAVPVEQAAPTAEPLKQPEPRPSIAPAAAHPAARAFPYPGEASLAPSAAAPAGEETAPMPDLPAVSTLVDQARPGPSAVKTFSGNLMASRAGDGEAMTTAIFSASTLPRVETSFGDEPDTRPMPLALAAAVLVAVLTPGLFFGAGTQARPACAG